VTTKSLYLISLAAGILLTRCVSTEGTVEIRGKILDKETGKGIPSRDVIVEGLLNEGDRRVTVETGQFSADSSGSFTYILRKVKGAYRYNFNMVGDSAYPFTKAELSIVGIQSHPEDVTLYMQALTDLTIIIIRKSKTPVFDTLALTWMSDRIYGRFLYPYRIINHGKTSIRNSENELRWIGGYVRSEVKARVFAGKMTRLRWDLDRNGRRVEFIDTITCRRDASNFIYFTY
jgi:hypothetical protein